MATRIPPRGARIDCRYVRLEGLYYAAIVPAA